MRIDVNEIEVQFMHIAREGKRKSVAKTLL